MSLAKFHKTARSPDRHALFHVCEQLPGTAQEIGARCQKNTPTVLGMLQRLYRKGYATRTDPITGQRRGQWRATDRGERWVSEYRSGAGGETAEQRAEAGKRIQDLSVVWTLRRGPNHHGYGSFTAGIPAPARRADRADQPEESRPIAANLGGQFPGSVDADARAELAA